MKNLVFLNVFFALAMVVSSCAQETRISVPQISDQHISFSIDGQSLRLSSVSE